jgi:hypothetical protein
MLPYKFDRTAFKMHHTDCNYDNNGKIFNDDLINHKHLIKEKIFKKIGF